jgi:hypothetical protein
MVEMEMRVAALHVAALHQAAEFAGHGAAGERVELDRHDRPSPLPRWRRPSVRSPQAFERRRIFPFSGFHCYSIDIRLIERLKFVDRLQNSIDPLSNEFDLVTN